jgi:hypothetical protein
MKSSSPRSHELTAALEEGVRLFNERHYFECHEVLEDAWRSETGPLRDLYQGLIKAAVGFYHAERGNFTGAVRVLRSGLPQLKPYQYTFRGLSLGTFIRDVERWYATFQQLEREDGRVDSSTFPTLTKVAQYPTAI